MAEKLLPPSLISERIIINKSLDPSVPAFPKLMEFLNRGQRILRHRGEDKSTRIHSHNLGGEVSGEAEASKDHVNNPNVHEPLQLSSVLEAIKEVKNSQVEY